MSDTCKYNCSAHPTEINAYGDISGIGVTTAFFATAWIVVLLLIGYYLVAYDPELDPFRKPGKKTLCQYPNAIDYVFLYAVRKLPGLRSLQKIDWPQYSQLESALNKCVMMFADIQISTGLAVMISGYIALSCGLQSYHWQLTVYLVWLGSLTHLAALSFLRNHLANSPRQLILRVTAMFMIMVLLEVAVGLAGHFNWSEGPSKASDFAVCYFRERMDISSVAFETMLKTLILLIYGFFIRIAKMSKRFEGWLRGVAAQLSTKAMRIQHRDGEGSPPRDPQGSLNERPTLMSQTIHPLLIAGYSLLNIHINLLTSFLAEVYWLTLSAIWATRRFFKTRQLGPKEEDEWTFGQILPLLLVVAPLAAILEHFLPCQTLNSTRGQSPDQIALLTRNQSEADVRQDEAQDQPETDEAQVEAQDDVRVGLDHQHIHSIAYRGAFLLAVVAYIEVGIFFVADLSPGIKGPLIRLGVAFFVLNPLLQLLWIHCSLWISQISWSSVVRNTIRGAAFGASMSISVNEFLRVSMKSKSDNREPVYSSVTSYLALGGGVMLSVTTLGHNRNLEGERGLLFVLVCIIYPIALVGICALMTTVPGGIMVSGNGILELLCNIGFCLCLGLFYYGYEWLLESRGVTPKYAFYLRCGLLFWFPGSLVVLQLLAPIAPRTTVLTASIISSAAIWSLWGTIVSFFRSRRTVTQDESASSIS